MTLFPAVNAASIRKAAAYVRGTISWAKTYSETGKANPLDVMRYNNYLSLAVDVLEQQARLAEPTFWEGEYQ